jgi:TonB family protein
MFKLATFALALSACATHTGSFDRDTAERSGIHLNLGASDPDSATAAFPEVLDRSVPTVDRMIHAVRARLGTIAVAQIELCVSPDGHVTKAAVTRGSGYEAFDNALQTDAAAWQFASMPGPSTVKSCRLTTVAYLAR